MNNIKVLKKMVSDGEAVAVLTAYDASMAAVQQRTKVDAILVGDSLGMVIQGHADTLPVTLDDMVYHTANVKRGAPQTFVIADMPFMSTVTVERGIDGAQKLMQQGHADMIKIEGAEENTLAMIQTLTRADVPICGHLGLQPQSVKRLGGFKMMGVEAAEATAIFNNAQALRQAGAQMLVLECVPADLAERISDDWREYGVVIGIGAGNRCHGQVLVAYDVLGLSSYVPKFAKNFLADTADIEAAFQAYVTAVKQRTFPE